MSRSDAERVSDILEASRELAEIVREGRAEFDRNPKSLRAAERLIDIIGEAAGSLSHEFASSHPDLPLNDAKSMRNVLSHEYWRSDPDTIWATSEISVPALAEQLRGL